MSITHQSAPHPANSNKGLLTRQFQLPFPEMLATFEVL